MQLSNSQYSNTNVRWASMGECGVSLWTKLLWLAPTEFSQMALIPQHWGIDQLQRGEEMLVTLKRAVFELVGVVMMDEDQHDSDQQLRWPNRCQFPCSDQNRDANCCGNHARQAVQAATSSEPMGREANGTWGGLGLKHDTPQIKSAVGFSASCGALSWASSAAKLCHGGFLLSFVIVWNWYLFWLSLHIGILKSANSKVSTVQGRVFPWQYFIWEDWDLQN